FFFFSSRRRHTRSKRDWSSDVCSSDLADVRCRRLSWFTLALLAGLCLRLGVVAVTNAFPQLQPMDAQGYDERAWTLVSVWRGGRSEERRVGKEGRCGGVTGVEGETLVR